MSDDIQPNKTKFAKNFFTDATNFIDTNINTVRFVSYGIAAVGCVIILKTTHAFRTFNTIKDIPTDYLRKGVKLQGRVVEVTSVGALQVKHIPIFKLPWRQEQAGRSLQLTLGGVEVLPSGVNWMQQNLDRQQIWFEALKVENINNQESLCCIITGKKKFLRSICINEEIIAQGLAKVQHIEGLSTPKYLKFSERLLKAEIKADKKGRGIWQRPSLIERLKNYPSNLLSRVKERFASLFKKKSPEEEKS